MTERERNTLGEIEKKLGYVFRDKALLRLAFTHSTYANTYGGEDNERLEYLGDAVLELIVSERQYSESDKRPGAMTEERQRLVSKNALLAAVENLDIKRYLRFAGRAENVGAKAVSSLFETVTAAIWLDGGYASAGEFVLKHIRDCAEENYKKILQELDRGKWQPVYTETGKTGPDNAPVFTFKVTVKDGRFAEGKGADSVSAQQRAAENLLKILKREGNKE